MNPNFEFSGAYQVPMVATYLKKENNRTWDVAAGTPEQGGKLRERGLDSQRIGFPQQCPVSIGKAEWYNISLI
jgi:hypothetical protein